MNAITTPNYFNRERPTAWSGIETISALNASEALKASGLDWTVSKVPLYAEGVEKPLKYNVAIKRDDDGSILGIVGSKYTPVQNADSLTFFDDVASQLPGMKYVAAGSVGLGKRVWLLADFGGFDAQQGDEIRKQIMLYNSHDGSSALSYMFVPNRVFCNNQIATILSGDKFLKIRHSRSANGRLETAKGVAHHAVARYDSIEDMYRALVRKPLTTDLIEAGLDSLYPLVEKGEALEGRGLTRRLNVREKITELIETGAGIEGRQRNAFSVYNAFTEYLSHHAQTNGASSEERRWANNVFGKGVKEIATVTKALLVA